MLSVLDAENDDRDNQNTLCIDAKRFKEEYMAGSEGGLFYDYIYYFVWVDLIDCWIEQDNVYLDFKNDQVRVCLAIADSS